MRVDWLRVVGWACSACVYAVVLRAAWAETRLYGFGSGAVMFVAGCGLYWGVVGFGVRLGCAVQQRGRYVDILRRAWVRFGRLVSVRNGRSW